MKPRSIFFLSLLVALSFAAILNVYSFQTKDDIKVLVFPPGSTYEKEWKKVDSLTNKGLYKSALDVVNGIYEKAKAQKNAPQLVKSIIHRMKFEQYMEEYSLEKAIVSLQKEVAEAKYPLKPVLQSMLAETYWTYYQNNRWKFAQRTQTVNFKLDDLMTWDLKTIVGQTILNYQASLQSSDSLKGTKLDMYDEVLDKQSDSKKYRPTLYDFLAHRALNFYKNTEPEVTKPAYHFEINSEDYFRPYDVFDRYDIQSKDSMSLKFYATKIFQEMLAFHANDANPISLIDDDIERLRFVRSHSTSEIKDSLFLEAIRGLEKRFYNDPSSLEATFVIATEYCNKAAKYNPLQSDENRWKYKEALQICEDGVKHFPNAYDTYNLNELIQQIKLKSLSFELEKVNAPNKPFLSLLKFRNVKKIYFRACPMDIDKFNHAVENLYGEKLIQKYLSLKPVKEWSVDLPDDGDYQQHSAEVKIPDLDLGHYVILASDDKSFTYKNYGIAYASCWASNISYVDRKQENGSYDFFVMHRQTGAPLKGVSAQLWYERYNYTFRKYEYVKAEKFTTDEKGFFNVPPSGEYRNFNVEFTYYESPNAVKDELHSDYAIYQYKEYPYEKKKYNKTFFFTDRSIYRPGQTIYFKGIMVNTDGETTEIVPNQSSTVTFYDVNSQKVADLNLTTNEYGSFNGTFTAPNGVLNGQMYLSNASGSIYFSVEDYKRPKFEVIMNPVKGSYKLEDEVKADGYAKAYAGSPIDGAQVKYRVVRNASFPYWWYYWRGYYPSSPEVEIANGVATTNDTGGFFINFKALADKSISKASSPTYTFTVYADVTDINGETHSSQNYVSVSYTALTVSVAIDDKVDRDGKNKFFISTANLSGQFEPAQGVVNVYKLHEPGKVFRKRTWNRPDKFLMTEAEFRAAFPNDVYDNEDDMYKWSKEATVFAKNFNNYKIPSKTKSPDKEVRDSIMITNLPQWKAGVYMIETKCKDKFGEEVKDVKYFTVYSTKDAVVPGDLTDWFTAVNVEGEPGETAKMLIGSKYSDVKVLYEIEHKNKIVATQFLTLNAEQKMIGIPIEEKHRGNFAAHFIFIRNNRVYNFDQVITVPYSNKELDIQFTSYRNKLLPGQQEEWKLKIKGKHGEKVAAEMMATLYDASLDAFRANNWYFNIYNSYYSSLNWQEQGFGANASSLYSDDWNPSIGFIYRYYDELNWYGYRYNYYHSYRGSYDEGGYDDAPGYYADGDMVMEEKNMEYDKLESRKDVIKKEAETEVTTNKPAPMSTGFAQGSTVSLNATSTPDTKNSFGVLGGEGGKGKDGKSRNIDLSNVSTRVNLNETAFFYPCLQTDEEGNVVVKFTVPEALTKWKMLGFAHTKDLKFSQITNTLVTQKELMVMPNAPRFFRENDRITFTTKISNLSDKDLIGKVDLKLFDATTAKEISTKMIEAVHGTFNTIGERDFEVKKGLSTAVSWEVMIPEGYGAINYKVVAKADNYSDGEETVVPVLTNRMLVTETMPLPIRSNQTKTFTFDKLISQNVGSTTLRNHKLTLEFTSNPAWYAVQALPYLMEYPYECAEQTFARYYSNSIASHIANSSPKIKAVFDTWKMKSPDAFLSNLQKNQELKALMLEETPWVLEAKDESERKKRVGLLFDMNKMANELDRAMYKLQKMQVSNGGWPWFEGMPDDRYITQYIVTGLGHLDHLGVKDIRADYKTWNMTKEGVRYLDDRIREDYEWILKHDKAHINEDHIWYDEIQYLYARSYFKDVSIAARDQKAFDYYKGQAQKYWLNKGRYMQGMIALALNRYDDKKTPIDIMKSIKETALNSEEMGMYWKDNYEDGWYWYQAPIESQALLIEAFDEVTHDKKAVDDLKVWLLKSKQTQDWKTTKATTEACYALLLRGTDWLATESNVEIVVGSIKIDPKHLPDGQQPEAGTGYFKTSWSGTEIKPEMGTVTVTKKDEGVSWGALYWQYFEQLDKITPAKTPLSLKKQLFIEKNTDAGPVITPITNNSTVKIGDKIKVRIELRVDRDMEYVQMKDMRASGFEPTNVFSQYKYQDGLGYYESTRDAATNFFFSQLHKGTYVFEYPLVVSHAGDFSNGITSIQCMYAPEFASHSEGIRVKVSK